MTLKLDDNGCCRIHSAKRGKASVSDDDGNGWIVTNKRYVVMPWKMVTRHGKNMTLAEAVDGIFSQKESEAKESERRERERKRELRGSAYEEGNGEIEKLGKLVYFIIYWIRLARNQMLIHFSSSRTEEEIKFVFDHLGWDYSPLCGAKPPSRAKPGPPIKLD